MRTSWDAPSDVCAAQGDQQTALSRSRSLTPSPSSLLSMKLRYSGGYAKEKAHQRMVAAGLVPSLLTWGTVMAGYFGPVDKEKMVQRMIASGVLPNVHTMILLCLAHSEFTERIRVFRSITTGAHPVKVSTTAVSKLFEDATFPSDTRMVLDFAVGFSDELLSSHIALGTLLPICADNDDSVLLRRLWWIGAERLTDSKLEWPGKMNQKFSVFSQISKVMPATKNRVMIQGADGEFGAKINGTYDRTFIDGSERYVKLGDQNTIIEYFGDKWRVKPLSAKGQDKCYAWVAGCSLESCASCPWTVLDGDAWSRAPSVKMKTMRTWALLALWLRGESDSLASCGKRGREPSDAGRRRTYETAASCLPPSASEPFVPMQAKSAKCASANFSDFFSRMSYAKALNEQAISMALTEQSNLALPSALLSTPEALDRPPVESFAPTPSPPKCDASASGVDASASADYHGTLSFVMCF